MFHREFLLMASALFLAGSVFAQEVDRSSFPQGMQVHGNAELTSYQDSAATGSGESGASRSSAVTVRSNSSSGGGVQIQGVTKITAEQKNVSATAVGKNNAAGNEVGVIGGK